MPAEKLNEQPRAVALLLEIMPARNRLVLKHLVLFLGVLASSAACDMSSAHLARRYTTAMVISHSQHLQPHDTNALLLFFCSVAKRWSKTLSSLVPRSSRRLLPSPTR